MNTPTERLLRTVLVVQIMIAVLLAMYLVGNSEDTEVPAIAGMPAVAGDGAVTGTTASTGSAGQSGTSAEAPDATVGGDTANGASPDSGSTGASTADGDSSAGSPTGDAATAADGTTGGTVSDGSQSASTGGPGAAPGPTEASSQAATDPNMPDFSDGTRIGVSDTTVRIGTLVSQTGAINFRSSAQATKAYIDRVNEAGGVHGRQIELLLRDDGLDPNRGQQAVEEMLNAGIFSFVAFNAPLTEGSMLEVLDKNDINMIGSFAMGSSELSYRFGAGYQNFGKVGGTRLCENGVTNPGLVYISNQQESLDANIFESWRRGAEQCGLTISDANLHAVDVTKADFSDVVLDLRFNGVDGIGTVLDATAMVRFQQALNRADYHPFHAALPFGSDESVLQDPNVGDSFAGLEVLSDVHFPGTEGMVEYEREVRNRFGDAAEINWAGAQGWVSAMVFVEALERSGPDLSRERFRYELDRIENFDTEIMFPLTFGEDVLQHSPNRCLKVGMVQPDLSVETIQGFTCVSDDLTRF